MRDFLRFLFGGPESWATPAPPVRIEPAGINYDRSPIFADERHRVARSYEIPGGYDVTLPRQAANDLENLLIRIAARDLAEGVWWPVHGRDAGIHLAGLRQLLSDRIAQADRQRGEDSDGRPVR